jgi:2-oxoglutarate ferredoxin oxidoreductase subunit beta
MKPVFEKTKGLTDTDFHYCPGCTHGIVHRLVAEAMEELGILDDAVAIAPVGCSVLLYNYLDCDCQQAAHGRAPAVATGIKRALPECIVFSYQGDGDLASIGTAEIVHAAHRNENITFIFINNAIYGMTGGQMAPTSLAGQVTSTSQSGRDAELYGYPLKISEMLAMIPGAQFVERVSTHDPANVRKAKKAILKAFQNQIDGVGFSLVEVLSNCPTNWGMTPAASLEWMKENMVAYYPLGNFKSPEGGE